MSRGFTLRGQPDPVPVGKIIALGRNYRAHAREMGETGEEPPLIFFKPPSALVPHGGQVVRPRFSLDLHHELELVVAIGRRCRHLRAEEAAGHILGYAVGLDMTLRDVQTEARRRGHPWAVAKGFDTSAPLSAVVPAARVADPDELTIELRVNGELRQRGRAGDMVLRVPEVVAFVSSVFTLDEGDLIFTGTPEGVGTVFPGDVLDAVLLGHTELRVTVADEDSAGTETGRAAKETSGASSRAANDTSRATGRATSKAAGKAARDPETAGDDERRGQAALPGGVPPSDARRDG